MSTKTEKSSPEKAGALKKGQAVFVSSESAAERDLHLVKKAKSGDKEAFRQIVVAYQEKIFLLARGLVSQKEDAQDIAQDVFVKAYRSLEYFKGESSFYTWLYRITINMVIDYRRKKSRKKETSYEDRIEPELNEDTELSFPINSSPQSLMLDRELAGKIQIALDSLPEDQRIVVVFREIEGLSYKEIADITNSSIGTVMSRLFYGRKKLQEILQDYI